MSNSEATIQVIDSFLTEPDRCKVSLISFSIPIPLCKLYIMDAAKLLVADQSEYILPVIYFTINSQTKKGRKAIALGVNKSIFNGYEVLSNSKNFSSYKVFQADAQILFEEVFEIIDNLFPAVSKEQVMVTFHRSENRMSIEE